MDPLNVAADERRDTADDRAAGDAPQDPGRVRGPGRAVATGRHLSRVVTPAGVRLLAAALMVGGPLLAVCAIAATVIGLTRGDVWVLVPGALVALVGIVMHFVGLWLAFVAAALGRGAVGTSQAGTPGDPNLRHHLGRFDREIAREARFRSGRRRFRPRSGAPGGTREEIAADWLRWWRRELADLTGSGIAAPGSMVAYVLEERRRAGLPEIGDRGD